MTTHPDTQNDLQDLEAQFRSELELSPEAQDLLFREARTANTFTDEPVSEEQVRAIYDLAKWAPTSMNNQPLRIVLVRTPGGPGPPRRDHGRRQQGQDLDRPAGGHPRHRPGLPRGVPRGCSRTSRAPATCSPSDAGAREAATLNGTLQVAYFILAVRAAGLAAGPMTGYDAEASNREFFPDGEHRVLTVVNIGKPGEDAWIDRAAPPRLRRGRHDRLTVRPHPCVGARGTPKPPPGGAVGGRPVASSRFGCATGRPLRRLPHGLPRQRCPRREISVADPITATYGLGYTRREVVRLVNTQRTCEVAAR